MNPLEALREALSVDRQTARFIFLGLGVIAAGAIAAMFNVNWQSSLFFGGYILVAGGAVYTLATVFDDPIIKKVLGWFVVVLLIVYTTTLFISAIFRPPGLLPAYCIVQFWRKCDEPGGLADQVAVSNFTPPAPAPLVVPAPTTAVNPAAYRVFIQFAGIIRREDVAALNQKLRGVGWNVQGSSGERTPSASGYNEVRFSGPDDEQAARALARAVQEANLTSASITAKRVPIVRGGVLEVWISR